MSITLNLPPDVEARIHTEAAKRQMGLEEYVSGLVSQSVAGDEEARRARAVDLLSQVDDIGDEQEQRETFEYLKAAIDEDRLSDRKRFG